MKVKPLISAMGAALLISMPVYAEEVKVTTTSTESVVIEANLNQEASANFVASADSMDAWIENTREAFGLDGWGENKGRYFLYSTKNTSLMPTDPQYGQSVAIAFEKAWADLQQQYLKARFGQIRTEKESRLYENNSTNNREFASDREGGKEMGLFDKIGSLFSKSVDVAVAKLDEQLVEMGTDPRELEKMPVQEKQDIINDYFIRTSITEASGEIAGLIPMQTKVIVDDSGATTVGIVGVASAKTLQIAKDIAMGRDTLIKGSSSGDLKSLLPSSDEDFVNEFGVRLVYEADGKPALISYGLSSYIPNKSNNYINGRLRSTAYENAGTLANAQIAEMVNGRMSTRAQTEMGEEIAQYVKREVKAGAMTDEQIATNIINIHQNTMRASAKMDLKGVSDLKRWRWMELNCHQFAVDVMKWSYSTLDAARSFNRPAVNTSSKVRSTATVKDSNASSYDRPSKKVNKLDDF